MSLLSRIAAPEATHELAALVAAVLSGQERPGVPGFPVHMPDREEPAPAEAPNARPLLCGPTGLGTSAARLPSPVVVDQTAVARGAKPRMSLVPTGLGTSAVRVAAERPAGDAPVPQMDRPDPARDDPVLGEKVNERPLLAGPTGLGTSAARLPSPVVVDETAVVPSAKPTMSLVPTGLGTSAARLPSPVVVDGTAVVPSAKPRMSLVPTGLGTSAVRVAPERPADGASVPQLYCPGPVRDDPVLGEVVNERLIEWAEEVGIYPGQLDRVRAANFGRLIMLTHPDTDDPDRLLAAAKCTLAEWSTDDHYVGDESLGADPKLAAARLALAHAVVDPAQLPVRYAPELERAAREDPVLVAWRSCLANLGRYASGTQLARLACQMAVTFLSWTHEVTWRTEGRTPPVWEYLVHRHQDSFLPCMVLIDAVGGYELPPAEFDDQRVRRALTMAGSAAVLVNDLYSMAKDRDSGIDVNLPMVIAAEEKCSLDEAIKRSVEIHNELVHTFETEAAVLSLAGSPALRRFLAGVWAWLGGNREWHSTSPRYNGANEA